MFLNEIFTEIFFFIMSFKFISLYLIFIINRELVSSAITSQSALDSLVSDLGETVMFYSKITGFSLKVTTNKLADFKISLSLSFFILIIVFKSSLSSYGSVIASAIKSSKNPNNDTIRATRVGAGDDDALKTAYNNFKSAYAKTVFSSTSSRRKRAAGYYYYYYYYYIFYMIYD